MHSCNSYLRSSLVKWSRSQSISVSTRRMAAPELKLIGRRTAGCTVLWCTCACWNPASGVAASVDNTAPTSSTMPAVASHTLPILLVQLRGLKSSGLIGWCALLAQVVSRACYGLQHRSLPRSVHKHTACRLRVMLHASSTGGWRRCGRTQARVRSALQACMSMCHQRCACEVTCTSTTSVPLHAELLRSVVLWRRMCKLKAIYNVARVRRRHWPCSVQSLPQLCPDLDHVSISLTRCAC